MKCLACGAKMFLMQVILDDPRMGPGLERHTFKCSACTQIARRIMFSRFRMPVTNLPVATALPETSAIKLQTPSTWTKAVEKLSSSQTALKESAAVAEAARTLAWAKAVEKVSSRQAAHKESAAAAAARTLAWAKAVEKVTSRHTAVERLAAARNL